MTGALARDDEVAGKATQGEWAACPREDTGHISDRQTTIIAVGGIGHFAATGMSRLDREDAEHIVRLHNRWPKYRALAEAARLAQARGLHRETLTCAIYDNEPCDCGSHAIDDALRELDAEDEQGGER